MNLLNERIKVVKDKHQKLLSCLLPLGDPDLNTSQKLIEIYMKAGVDIIELGMPSKNPYLDSVYIADSNRRSFNNQPDIAKYFETLKLIRKDYPKEPFEVMAYSDIVKEYGVPRFLNLLFEAEINAHLLADATVIYPDLVKDMDHLLEGKSFYRIRFMPHPFQEKLLDDIGKNAHGFMIFQSFADQDGKREHVAEVNQQLIKKVRDTKTVANILLAYGIYNGIRAKEAIRLDPDGILVGSAMVWTINSGDFKALSDLIKEIKEVTIL